MARVSEKSDFEKAGVIGSRGKLRTRIRGGVLDHQRKAKMLLIRRYGTEFLWMSTGEKELFMMCARWAAVRVKPRVGGDVVWKKRDKFTLWFGRGGGEGERAK